MEVLIAHRVLQLLIIKINIEILEKFDIFTIAQYQLYCALLLIIVLYIYIGINSVNDN